MSAAEPTIGRLLLSAFQLFEDRLVEGIRSMGFPDFRLTDTYVLRNLDPGGTRITTIAERARITKQSASELVQNLVRRGYVECGPDPADGRAKLVRLADRGSRVVDAARRSHAALVEEWTDVLGPRDLDALRGLLARLLQAHDVPPSFVDPLDR